MKKMTVKISSVFLLICTFGLAAFAQTGTKMSVEGNIAAAEGEIGAAANSDFNIDLPKSQRVCVMLESDAPLKLMFDSKVVERNAADQCFPRISDGNYRLKLSNPTSKKAVYSIRITID